MTTSVRPVDVQAESGEVLQVLEANLLAVPHARRFQWLYQASPDGPARTWFAVERATDRIVGVASVFPRTMWIGNQRQMCGQVGDFAIAASHRSLGPAVMLQRATFEPVDRNQFALCYDCPPHAAAMATFRRLGYKPNCMIERYALPLRIDRHLRKYCGVATPAVASLGNAALRIYRRAASHRKALDVQEHEGRFGDEFSDLDRSVISATEIRVQRGAAQLNWRYRDDPLQTHRVLTARRRGELVGFIIFSETAGMLRIEDLFGKELSEAGVALLETVIERRLSTQHGIEAFLSSENPLVGVFLKAGFYRRPVAGQVVAYTGKGTATSAFVQQNPTWAFTGTDMQA